VSLHDIPTTPPHGHTMPREAPRASRMPEKCRRRASNAPQASPAVLPAIPHRNPPDLPGLGAFLVRIFRSGRANFSYFLDEAEK
jgi:hypothetical protein